MPIVVKEERWSASTSTALPDEPTGVVRVRRTHFAPPPLRVARQVISGHRVVVTNRGTSAVVLVVKEHAFGLAALVVCVSVVRVVPFGCIREVSAPSRRRPGRRVGEVAQRGSLKPQETRVSGARQGAARPHRWCRTACLRWGVGRRPGGGFGGRLLKGAPSAPAERMSLP